MIASTKINPFNVGALFLNADGLQLLVRPEEVTHRVTFFYLKPLQIN
jgi:hypothetical protein